MAAFLVSYCVLLLPALETQQQEPQVQRKRQRRVLKIDDAGPTYKAWLEEDVRWIISKNERAAFMQLSNDEERDQFIDAFWLRRDSTPDTIKKEFRDEHYRRIAYANEQFGANEVPGWRTDRGRVYIVYGPPDEVESHPTASDRERPPEEGGGRTHTFPYVIWRYRDLEGFGKDVQVDFVDACSCGDYRLSLDPASKDAIVWAPFAAREPGPGLHTPSVWFKDLEEVVTHKLVVSLLPFDVRTDFTKVTNATTLVQVAVQLRNRDLVFVRKDAVEGSAVNIFGRVTAMTGRVMETFEDTLQVHAPNGSLPGPADSTSLCRKTVPLRPGRYRLDLAVKDVNGDRVGTWSQGIEVP
jgi:GWxTD domain-containing protein